MSTTQGRNRGSKKLGGGSTSSNGRIPRGRVEPEAVTEAIALEPPAQTAPLPVIVDAEAEQKDPGLRRPEGRFAKKQEARLVELEARDAYLEGLPEFTKAQRAAAPLSGRQRAKAAAKAAEYQAFEHLTLQRKADQGAPMTQAENLRLMQLGMTQANETYLESLQKADFFVEGFTPEKQEKEVNLHQKLYVKSMVLAGVAPMVRGVNARSVAQSLGMMTAMALLSKDYREELGSYFKPLKDAIEQKREARVASLGEKAHFKVDQHNAIVDRRTARMIEMDPSLEFDEGFKAERQALRKDTGDVLTKKWDKRLKQMEFVQRGHREPYTAQSAALTEMGITQNAYHKLREPGVSPEQQQKIYRGYQAMVQKVRNDADADGISGEEVYTAQKMMIGDLMESNPVGITQVYNGLAYGKYEKAPMVDVKFKGNDEIRKTWLGDFADHRGNKVPANLMFTLRGPEGRLQHENQMGQVMNEHMEHTLSRKGIEEYTNEDLSGYIMGWKVYERNREALDRGEAVTFGDESLPLNIRSQVKQAQVMISSMAGDGLSLEEQRLAYSNSFVDAVKNLRDKHPDMALTWDKQYGESWSQRMEEALGDPEAYFEEERNAQHAFAPGPDGLERVRVFPEQQAQPQPEHRPAEGRPEAQISL